MNLALEMSEDALAVTGWYNRIEHSDYAVTGPEWLRSEREPQNHSTSRKDHFRRKRCPSFPLPFSTSGGILYAMRDNLSIPSSLRHLALASTPGVAASSKRRACRLLTQRLGGSNPPLR